MLALYENNWFNNRIKRIKQIFVENVIFVGDDIFVYNLYLRKNWEQIRLLWWWKMNEIEVGDVIIIRELMQREKNDTFKKHNGGFFVFVFYWVAVLKCKPFFIQELRIITFTATKQFLQSLSFDVWMEILYSACYACENMNKVEFWWK